MIRTKHFILNNTGFINVDIRGIKEENLALGLKSNGDGVKADLFFFLMTMKLRTYFVTK